MGPQRSGNTVTRDGTTLQYTVHGGAQSGRPGIVLVHSLAMAGIVWEAVAEQLSATAAVLTYDCRGHGASANGPGPYRLETFAHDLADLLDSLAWNSVHLAGASMGGNVALQFAALYPNRVLSLGLVDTTAWYGPDATAKWEQRARKAEEQGLTGLIDFQESRWFSDAFRSANGEGVQRCRSVFLANEVACFAATCRMLAAFDLRAALAGMRMPTAIVVGEDDYATPVAMAREMRAGIAAATLKVIPKVRHLTFVECPDIVAGALSELHTRVPDGA